MRILFDATARGQRTTLWIGRALQWIVATRMFISSMNGHATTFGGTEESIMKRTVLIAGVVAMLVPIRLLAYDISGRHWDFGNPTQVAVTVDGSIPSAWYTAVIRSMNTWSAAGAKFRFVGGTAGHVVALRPLYNSNILGVTYNREWFGTRITDRDTDLNSQLPWSTDGRGNANDVQNVLTHELGHWLMLNDLTRATDSLKTMYGSAQLGETIKRTLEPDDVYGIKIIYGW